MLSQYKNTIRFIALSLGFGIQGVVWTCIPIIFYRPNIVCESQTQQPLPDNLICNEFELCKIQELQNISDYYQNTYYNNILYKSVIQYDQIYSISMEFQLFCKDKIIEANVLSFAILGQVLGGIVAFCYRINRKNQQNMFIYLLFIQFIQFLLCNFITSVFQFSLLFFLWNFIACYYQCLVYTHISNSFEGGLNTYGPTLCNVIWTMTSILYVIVTIFLGNWRHSLGYFLCLLAGSLCLILIIFKINIDDNQNSNQDEIEQQQKTVKDQIIYNIKYLSKNHKIRSNFIIWAINMMTGTLAYYIVALVLNTLVGDLYANTLGCTILETLAQGIAGILIYMGFDQKKILINIFYIIGFSYSLCVFVQDSNDTSVKNMSYITIFIKLLPIIIGKGTHEMLWTMLYQYMPKVVPEELQQFNAGFAQVFTISICSLMPYYKYIMEFFSLNSFVCLGILCFITAKYSYFYHEIDEKIEDTQNTKDIPLISLDQNDDKLTNI